MKIFGMGQPALTNDTLNATIARGYINDAIRLLTNGCIIDDRDSNGETPLTTAASACNYAIIEELLARKANPNIANGLGKTPLYIIAERVNLNKVVGLEVAQLLLDHGADTNLKVVNLVNLGILETPFQQALRSGNTQLIKKMLNEAQPGKQGNVNLANPDGFTPFMFAVSSGDIEIAKLFINLGANPHAVTKVEKFSAADFVNPQNIPFENTRSAMKDYLTTLGLDTQDSLNSSELGSKKRAIERIALMGNATRMPELFPVLKNEKDKNVCVAAINALGDLAPYYTAIQREQACKGLSFVVHNGTGNNTLNNAATKEATLAAIGKIYGAEKQANPDSGLLPYMEELWETARQKSEQAKRYTGGWSRG